MVKKTTKKTATKKATTKKTAAKKAPAKKAPVKKAAAKKAPAKKAAAKKSAPKQTTVIARVDVGFGNNLYLRGEGAGLSWDKGTLMENISPYEWGYKTNQAKSGIVFKFAINDEIWAEGENLTVAAGDQSISTPSFIW